MLYQTGLDEWCTLRWSDATERFGCDGRAEQWDRYGRALTGSTRDLDQFPTLVKDGRAYLSFNSLSGGRVLVPGP
jgi:hypothetical protein